jgi:hypothetical protein
MSHLNVNLLMDNTPEAYIYEQIQNLLTNGEMVRKIYNYWLVENGKVLAPIWEITDMNDTIIELSLELGHLEILYKGPKSSRSSMGIIRHINPPESWKRKVFEHSRKIYDNFNQRSHLLEKYVSSFIKNEKNFANIYTYFLYRYGYEWLRFENIDKIFQEIKSIAKYISDNIMNVGTEIGKNTSCKICNKIAAYIDTENNKFCSYECQKNFY